MSYLQLKKIYNYTSLFGEDEYFDFEMEVCDKTQGVRKARNTF